MVAAFRQWFAIALCVLVFLLTSCIPQPPDAPSAESATDPGEAVAQTAETDAANSDADELNMTTEDGQSKISDIAFFSGRANSGPVKERIVLLAYKWNVDQPVVEEILHDYLQEHRAIKTNSDFAATIQTLSDRTNVAPDRVAQLVMDYKAWLNNTKAL